MKAAKNGGQLEYANALFKRIKNFLRELKSLINTFDFLRKK